MNTRFAIVLAVVGIDMIGMGLVMPVLPSLLRRLGHTGHITIFYGALMAAYAAMQFVFSPLLGSLSDRWGRRPVLLVSLAGAAIDYLITAAAPNLAVLAAGRILAGVTGANVAVASSIIADLTAAEARAKRFGQMSAVLGLGFVAGPLVGGLLGGVSLRAPYLLAALLNAGNFVLVLKGLPETRPAGFAPPRISWRSLIPSLRIFASHPGLPRLVATYALLTVAAQVPMSCWILYCQGRYGWGSGLIGLSLALYGLLHAGAQFSLVVPVTRRLGERGGVLLGVLTDATANVSLGLAAYGWMAFALMPLWCVGGIALPSLQSLLSRDVPPDAQGRLQGALVSLASLIGIPGPLLATFFLAHSPADVPGAIWLGAAAIEIAALLPLATRRQFISLRAR